MSAGWLPPDKYAVAVDVKWREQVFSISSSFRKAAKASEVLLLCLHGVFCNRGDFTCILASEALQHCGVLAVDLPGHGGSCKLPVNAADDALFPAALEDMADIVWCVLESLRLQAAPVVLIGHSMGGAVGLLMCKRSWPQLRAFVSLEGCLVATDTPPNGLMTRWSRRNLQTASSLDLIDDIAAAAHLGRDPTGILHWRDSAAACGSTAHLLATRVARSLVSWSTSGELPELIDTVPAFHYVGGLGSGKLTPTLIAVFATRANCRIHALGGTGHFLLLDAQKATVGIIAAAVSEVAFKEVPSGLRAGDLTLEQYGAKRKAEESCGSTQDARRKPAERPMSDG